MSRHLVRPSEKVASHRDHANDNARGKTSAISGHVDYLELAERVIQGVSVESYEDAPRRPRKPRREP